MLLDECPPRKLKGALSGHQVATVPEMAWAGSKNGELLRLAEQAFDVFVTSDQNLQYQQNLSATTIAVVVLAANDNRLATLQPLMPKVAEALPAIQADAVIRIGA